MTAPRLLLDQNLRVETTTFLRALGADAVSTRDLGLSRATDAEILAAAKRERRVIVTFNADFADVRDLGPDHPGVVRLRIEPQTLESVHPVLAALLRDVAPERLIGALTTVTRTRVRIRQRST